MDEFVSRHNIFSPRWGHEDPCTLRFKYDELTIEWASKKCVTCRIGKNGDPEWSGERGGSNHPLSNYFHNDSIYAPDIVPFALEEAWKNWRNGEVSDAVLKDGLNELFNWIDSTSRGKPNGKLWEGVF